jgi:hypothetical protein
LTNFLSRIRKLRVLYICNANSRVQAENVRIAIAVGNISRYPPRRAVKTQVINKKRPLTLGSGTEI